MRPRHKSALKNERRPFIVRPLGRPFRTPKFGPAGRPAGEVFACNGWPRSSRLPWPAPLVGPTRCERSSDGAPLKRRKAQDTSPRQTILELRQQRLPSQLQPHHCSSRRRRGINGERASERASPFCAPRSLANRSLPEQQSRQAESGQQTRQVQLFTVCELAPSARKLAHSYLWAPLRGTNRKKARESNRRRRTIIPAALTGRRSASSARLGSPPGAGAPLPLWKCHLRNGAASYRRN